MVYGGKPSTGCYLCRKRKIKCDEGRPECRNCGVYGRPCPGYRPDAVFRNETRKVERQAKKDTSSSSCSSETQSTASQSLSVVDRRWSSPSQTSALTLHRIADATWQERAVCYFFDQFTITGEGEDGMGHLEYLPPLYARCGEIGHQSGGSPSACLRWAVDATALMTFANVTHAPPLIIKARQSYGKAIHSLREALDSPTLAAKDETFASVVLLSLFEDITGERNGLFSSHTAGFEFLMKLRGESQLGHQRGRDMFNFAYAHTFVEILALGDKPRYDIDWVLTLLDENDPIESLMLAASKLSQLFLSMQSSPSPPDPATVESWIIAGKECDVELSQWTLHLPDRWLPLVVYSDQGEPLVTYNRISNAVIWNYYRAVRVMLQQLLLNLNRTLLPIIKKNKPPGYSQQPASILNDSCLRSVIQEMTSDVCRSIPFSLGDVDKLGRPTKLNDESRSSMRAAQGYGLLWPLWYILSCGMPTPTQVNQIRTVLSRIGSTLGIKLALILAREAEQMREDPTSSRAPVIGPPGKQELSV
ncbi:transcriptional regulator family: Fungal Specific TF [Penicillium macrosclerotiorum]|uniref:transcriptional regulator family: Fungal Specific TF n=1 Tax=Penicillium macrosclerotiorum TaxID=303699 RepID=UPI002547F1AC|nr:transcriptional regulator family: Fungal Specific TF [Penicillium macrosclerotiorum]KAJ5666722.1 transcriptional regulator family: Fungal Specific TF [Penicillium macrosclerotiorum]